MGQFRRILVSGLGESVIFIDYRVFNFTIDRFSIFIVEFSMSLVSSE